MKPGNEMTSIKELTKELKIPYHFVAKILQDLTRKGLLVSLRGPAGGFALGMPAKEITLYRIVEAVDGPAFMNSCVMGFPECTGKNPCAVHEKWDNLRESIHSMLVSKNILEMADANKKPQYRLSGVRE